MPNIQTKQLTLIDLPAIWGEYRFEFIATSDRGERLLFTTYRDKQFFLQITERPQGFLIKADKLTRVTPVTIIQNALKGFSALHNLELTFSNIDGKSEHNRLKEDKGVLKNAHYFVDEYQSDKEMWIEVGFGSGRHLLHQAKQNPHIQFVGLEIHKPSIEQVIKQCHLQNIENIFILDFDARVFMQLLSSNTVGRIFVHFPVPWDKKPHRRVISKAFVQEALRVLKVDGTLELRTDSENYFTYSFETMQALNRYALSIRKNHDLSISSKYEDRWKRMEKNIYDVTLKNDLKSPQKEAFGTLTFDNFLPFSEVKKRFSNRTIKGDDYFVHFENLYEINENEGLLKVSLGSSEKCEHKYLLFKNNMIKYFPNDSLPIAQNYKSHNTIKEFLNV